MMVREGDAAIDFELPGSTGVALKLSDFKGKLVVLYFYPRDNTPGCAKEACSFRDVYTELLACGAEVIGVSPDGISSHSGFAAKYGLRFHLLSDTEHRVAESYGAWGEKKLYGKTRMGIIRSTFVIGRDFNILRVYPNVTPDGHGDEILAFIKGLEK